jgi:hypothetical protein
MANVKVIVKLKVLIKVRVRVKVNVKDWGGDGGIGGGGGQAWVPDIHGKQYIFMIYQFEMGCMKGLPEIMGA